MSQAPLYNTPLKDRTLWFDGDSTIDGNRVLASIQNNEDLSSLFVSSLTPKIVEYNRLVRKEEQITVKTSSRELMFGWNIPDEYNEIDIVSYISSKHYEMAKDLHDLADREMRCAVELKLYQEYHLFDTLKALIYIINTLVEKDIVWGVGRGSSVSSYILYILGIHDIDSYRYNLNIEEFLRDPRK